MTFKKILITVAILLGIPAILYAGQTTLFVDGGGTGQRSFTQGWINSLGGTNALTASTSPTVNYITATSTTATSTFANGVNVTSGCLAVNGTCVTGTGGSGTVTSIATTFPILGGTITNTGTLTFGGLSTSSAAVVSNIPYFSGVNTFSNVATTSVTCTGNTTCTAFTVIGASPITINSTGGSTVIPVSTSTAETQGQLAYWTTTNGSPARLSTVATSSAACAGSITCSGFTVVGSVSPTIALTWPWSATTNFGKLANATTTQLWLQGSPFSLTASSTSVFSYASTSQLTLLGTTYDSNNAAGTAGQVLMISGGLPVWSATGSALTAIGPTGQTSTGPIITLATSTNATNGITSALTIVGSGSTMTFTPSQSGTLTVAGGGTGQSTFTSSQLLYGNGTNALSSVGTSSASCTGSASCSGFTVVGGVSPAINVANTIANGLTGQTAFGQGMLAINDSLAMISTTSPTIKYIVATSSIASILPYASTTGLTVTGGSFLTGTVTLVNTIASQLLAANTNNQIIGAMLNSPLSLSGGTLSCTNCDTGTGNSGQVSFFSGTSALSGDNGLFWDNTFKRLGLGTTSPAFLLSVQGNGLISGNLSLANLTATGTVTTVNASTTRLTASGYLEIPAGTASTSGVATGQTFIQTTAASTSLRFYDGTATRVLSNQVPRSMILASSTLAFIGSFGSTGTTTLNVMNNPYPMTLTRFFCKTDAGTVNVLFGNGTASTTSVRCTNTGTDSGTSLSNNGFSMFQNFMTDVGDSSATFNTVTITTLLRNDAD